MQRPVTYTLCAMILQNQIWKTLVVGACTGCHYCDIGICCASKAAGSNHGLQNMEKKKKTDIIAYERTCHILYVLIKGVVTALGI